MKLWCLELWIHMAFTYSDSDVPYLFKSGGTGQRN